MFGAGASRADTAAAPPAATALQVLQERAITIESMEALLTQLLVGVGAPGLQQLVGRVPHDNKSGQGHPGHHPGRGQEAGALGLVAAVQVRRGRRVRALPLSAERGGRPTLIADHRMRDDQRRRRAEGALGCNRLRLDLVLRDGKRELTRRLVSDFQYRFGVICGRAQR